MEKLLLALAALPFGLGVASAPSEARPDGDVVFSFTDPAIIESSGLVVHDGLFATVNDSGDAGRVFTVDPATGDTVAVTRWEGEPEDVEAMALTRAGRVLVGDIGDNTASRDAIELVEVPFGEDGGVEPTTYELAYPDGSHDAETLLVHPTTGQVLVVAKEFIGRLFAAPAELDPDGTNRLRALGEVLPIATDGAFFPDGRHFVLRDYGSAAFYAWPSLDLVGEIELPDQPQGEGIAVSAAGAVYVSSEGEFSDVLRIALPQRLQAEIDGTTRKPGRGGGDAVSDETLDRDPTYDSSDLTRPLWPWAAGGLVGVVLLLVLIRSLRPRP